MSVPTVSPEQRPAIVIIEDDSSIRRFLRNTLDERYDLHEASEGGEGLKLIGRLKPAVVIVDLGLPDMDGIDLIESLREWSSVPVLVLSARDQENDKIGALDAGADDYLVKPFGVGELEARLRAALRRGAQNQEDLGASEYAVGGLRVDLLHRLVSRDGETVHLTPIEYKLLVLLIRHAGRVLTHRQLLKSVWGAEYAERNHYLRIYMAQLRQKLEADPTRPRYLLTELGIGYRMAAE